MFSRAAFDPDEPKYSKLEVVDFNLSHLASKENRKEHLESMEIGHLRRKMVGGKKSFRVAVEWDNIELAVNIVNK